MKGILAAIEVLLQDGQVNLAAKKLKNAQSKVEALDKKIAAQYENTILLLQKRIVELRDWQGFAAIPKKQELIANMQKLVGAALPPGGTWLRSGVPGPSAPARAPHRHAQPA